MRDKKLRKLGLRANEWKSLKILFLAIYSGEERENKMILSINMSRIAIFIMNMDHKLTENEQFGFDYDMDQNLIAECCREVR